MILTLTMNPSVDISYHLDELNLDTVNRVDKISKTAGGKGLNVTKVLHILGANVSATGLLGGRLGEVITDQLSEKGIKSEFYNISGDTRNCVAILHNGNQTEINESGPVINSEESQGFIDHLKNISKDTKLVSISGSLPKGLPSNYYSKIIDILDAKVLLDTSGQALKDTLLGDNKPFLIKPNNEELSDLLGYEVSNKTDDLEKALSNDLFKGIEWIVISQGSSGAFAKHNDNIYEITIPSVEVISPVGSGDATVAGLAYGLDNDMNDEEILRHAMTCGILNAMEVKTGHINMDNFDEIYSKVKVKKIK